MTTGPINDNDSPLDEILDNLPQETPPADLQQRCMSAVRAAERKFVPARPANITGFIKAAAGVFGALLLVVMLGGVASTFRGCAKSPMAPPPPPMGMAPSGPSRYSEVPRPGALAPMPPLPMPTPGAPAKSDATSARAPEAAKPGSRSQAKQEPPPPSHAPAAATLPMAGASGGGHSWERPVAPEQPWRDESGDRQKITQKRMELEVKKVEEAHDRAISIINKAQGHTTTEDLQITEAGKNKSHIVAQVPVDALDGVVAQLRELGKVRLLTGTSEDVSKEYYGRGEDIREAGSSEDELVAKYEAEQDPATKRQLYNQIQAVRSANKQGKRTLGDLSEKTHYALLDLTLIEQASPSAFLTRALENSENVGGWLLATAIVWLPIVVIAWLVWRRRRP